jgi:hypothetical protein
MPAFFSKPFYFLAMRLRILIKRFCSFNPIRQIMARFDFSFFDSGVRFDTPDANPSSRMRNLARFLDNPFDDKNISETELATFTVDHLVRMAANNASGELTVRLTATQSAFDLFADCVTDDGVRLAIRKARNLAKTNYRTKTIIDHVARIEGALVSAFGEASPVIVEALPRGRTIFRECGEDEMAGELAILLKAVLAHQANLLPAIVTLATDLKTNWEAVNKASDDSTGSRAATQDGKKMASDGLRLMLYLNLCKLMEMFPRQPEKMAIYMQQHLLENPERGKEPEAPAPAA